MSQLQRRRFLIATGMLLAAPLAVEAQQTGKVWRIGFLGNTEVARIWAGLEQELQNRGYVAGKNVVFERRFAEGRADRYPAFAAELVRLNVDVIVASANVAARAVKDATATIPIVVVLVSDPVGMGLVASLARPGGNVTGLADLQVDLVPKRLELLKSAVPKAERVVFLRCLKCAAFDTSAATETARVSAWETAAKRLGITLAYVDLSAAQDLESATAGTLRAQPDAVFLGPNPINFMLRRELADFGMRHGLPVFGFSREMAAGGSVMSYGPNFVDVFRKAAVLVDRILKGTKPADLPVEQPTVFELVINLKTAKALGLTIPQSILLRADEVIE